MRISSPSPATSSTGPWASACCTEDVRFWKRCRRFCTGGEMIESVTREGAVYAEVPHKFEAGTVNAAGAAGLHAAIDYVGARRLRRPSHARELALSPPTRFARMLRAASSVSHPRRRDKAEEHNGILTFVVDGVHPHDVSELLAADGVAVRAGHHCAAAAPDRILRLSRHGAREPSHSIMTTPDVDRLCRKPFDRQGAHGLWTTKSFLQRDP